VTGCRAGVILLASVGLVAACGGAGPVEEATTPIPTETPTASPPDGIASAFRDLQPLMLDVGNAGDATDLSVHLETRPDGLALGESRLLLMRVGEADDLTLEAAMVLPDSHTIPLPGLAAEGAARPPAGAADIDGVPISEDREYVAKLMWSYGPLVLLSRRSEPFTLRNEATVHTLVTAFPSATGGLAVDAEGLLYAADIGPAPQRNGSTIYRITPEGEVEVWISGEGLSGASGNTFGPDGNLYQSSLNANAIHRITPDGSVSTVTADGILGPVGIASAPDGSLLVANCRGGSIQRVGPEGTSELYAQSSLFACPNGITTDDDGVVYVANFSNMDILRVTPVGEVAVLATLPGGNNGHILYQDGRLIAVSRGGHRIYSLTLDGDVEVLAGTGERGHRDGPALQATFSLPNDVVASTDGRRLYVNEVVPVSGSANHPSRVRVIELPRAE
jgi:sugar lactone lactonase YvrE